MREELLKKIKEDERLLELFLIVKINNFTLAETKKGKARTKIDGAFNYLDYDDFLYLDYTIAKWKGTNQDNVDKEVEEEISYRVKHIEEQGQEPPTEEEQLEAKERLKDLKLAEHKLYLAEIEETKENIDLDFIIRALFVYYDLAVFSDIKLFHRVGDVIKTIEDHEGEPIANDLKKLLRDLVKARGKDIIDYDLKTIKDSLEKADIEDYNYYFHLCKLGLHFKRVFKAHTKGKLFSYPKERVAEKLNAYNKKSNKEDIETFRSTLEEMLDQDYKELGTTGLIEQVATLIVEFLKYARQCDEINLHLDTVLHDLREKYTVDLATVEKGEVAEVVIEEHNEKRNKELFKIREQARKNLAKIDAKEFLQDAEDNAPIKEFLRAFSSVELAKEVIDFKPVKNEDDPRNFLESLELNRIENQDDYIIEEETIEAETIEEEETKEEFNGLALTEEEIEEATLSEWTKTNVNPVNNDIKIASQRIAYFNEKPLAKKMKRLKELELKDNLTEDEKEEELELKDNIEASLKEKEHLEEKLKVANEDLVDLRNDYLNEKNPKEKKDLGRLIKKIEKDTNKIKTTIDEKYSKTNSFLQLSQDFTTGAELLVSNEGNIQLTIKNNDLSKYNAEVERLVYFLEDLFYRTIEDNRDAYYLIDIDAYARKTGRTPSTRLRKQIEDALDILQNETFITKGEYKGFNIKGNIKRVGSYFTIEPKGTYENVENTSRKTNYLLTLDRSWRDILWHNKAHYWASIPNKIMKLENATTRGLGFYLYETLKKGIKEPGYYVRKFKMKTLVDTLNKRGLLATNTSNKYSRRVIEPLRKAFNELKDIGLITYDEENKDNAFKYYEEHLVGKKNLEAVFEQKSITIKFLVYDKELYDQIAETNIKNRIEAKKRKTRKKNKESN